jgi:phenylacetate-CoA ligase
MVISSLGSVAKLRRNILLPIYWNYIRRLNTLKYYEKLKKIQWNTMEENRKIQRKKLYELIKYANQNIPYYRKIIKKYNIQFSEDTIFGDIKKIPVLTKKLIRNHFDELYIFKDNTYYRNTSGGSTGEAVIFFQDKQYLEWANATKRLFNKWAGRKPGEPMVKLWGSLRDILQGGRGFKGYLRQQISGVTILNSYRMTEKNMYEYVKRINSIKPCLILSFTNSIDELARFIQKHGLSIYSPSAVMTSAGVLYPEVRARIKEVFRAPVFNRYGSREVGDIACNCEKNQGLHIIPNIHYIEILDNRGKEVKNGAMGEIAVTILTNYTMPLIRYKIGDRGVLSEKECSCGRGFPLLEKVEGRVRSMFRNKQGDLIDSGVFIRLFYFRDNIKQFQVIQESLDQITINLVLKDKQKLKVVEKDFREISEVIKPIMGNDTKVKYNIVNEIKHSPSGKYMYTFSKIKNEGKIQMD